MFCCLRRNVEASCHKHFAVVSREQQTTPLTSDECHKLKLPRSGDIVCITLGGRIVDNTQWSQILMRIAIFVCPQLDSTPPLRWSPSKYCHNVWYEKKLEWCGYSTVKKI